MKPFAVSGLLLVVGLGSAPSAGAQSATRAVWSAGLATGVASLPSSGNQDPRSGQYHSALLVEFAPRRLPLELRGELAWAHWASFAGPVSLAGNLVLPVGVVRIDRQAYDARLRPYALGGAGVYGVGGVSPRDIHWNAGAGLRVEAPRWTVFVEGRRLAAYDRTLLAAGFTVGR